MTLTELKSAFAEVSAQMSVRATPLAIDLYRYLSIAIAQVEMGREAPTNMVG